VSRRFAVAFLTASALPAAAAVAVSSAPAATVKTDRRCYTVGQPIKLSGDAFTPGAPVAFTLDGEAYGSTTASQSGAVRARGRAPSIERRFRRATLTATDQGNSGNTATTRFMITRLDVQVTPRAGGRPDRMVTFRARGFRPRSILYVHYINPRGNHVRSVRLGRLTGPCGVRAARTRLIPYDDARVGRWRLRFDTRRSYSGATRPQVRLTVRVRPPE